MRSNRFVWRLILSVLLLLLTGMNAEAITYTGNLTGAGGGIIATADWNSPSTSFGWTVTSVGTAGGFILWQYDYTFSVPQKAISHLLLEVTDPSLRADYTFITGTPSVDSPKTFTPSGSSGDQPNMPGNLYGLKYEDTDLLLTFSFTTVRSPVWGDFYAKDGTSSGIKVTAWNAGFLAADPLVLPHDGSQDGHILRPDGGTTVPPPVPIPAAFWLLGSGLIGLIGIRRKMKG
jgi:hypothetical protein